MKTIQDVLNYHKDKKSNRDGKPITNGKVWPGWALYCRVPGANGQRFCPDFTKNEDGVLENMSTIYIENCLGELLPRVSDVILQIMSRSEAHTWASICIEELANRKSS